jgi:hypothetical protein
MALTSSAIGGFTASIHTRDADGAPVFTRVSPCAPFSPDVVLAQNSTLTVQSFGHRTLMVDLLTLRRAAPWPPAGLSRTTSLPM